MPSIHSVHNSQVVDFFLFRSVSYIIKFDTIVNKCCSSTMLFLLFPLMVKVFQILCIHETTQALPPASSLVDGGSCVCFTGLLPTSSSTFFDSPRPTIPVGWSGRGVARGTTVCLAMCASSSSCHSWRSGESERRN